MANKNEWLHTRLTPEASAMIAELKADYGIDNNSELFRRMLIHIHKRRPALITPTLPPTSAQRKGRKTTPRNGAEGAP